MKPTDPPPRHRGRHDPFRSLRLLDLRGWAPLLFALSGSAALACATEDEPGGLEIRVGAGGDTGAAGNDAAGGGGTRAGGAAGSAAGQTSGVGGSASGTGASAGSGGSGSGASAGSGGSTGTNAGSGGSAGTSANAGGGGTSGTGGSAAGGEGGGLAGTAGEAGAGGSVIDPPDETLAEVHPAGRYQTTAAGLRSSWSGSSLTTTFNGTGLAVTFEAAGNATDYEVIVDGARLAANKIELVAGEKTYPVVSGLPLGEHTATLHRRTEASTGATVWKGFTVTAGALVKTPRPFAHRIEFVGDSITCGYGTECATASEAFSTKTENHWLTFGAGAARIVNADAHFVAWSGKGMFHNYGNEQSAKMPELFPRTIGAEAKDDWDFASWKPEVVVINLGTNDWNGGVDTAAEIVSFQTAYRAFIDKLVSYYPGVVIYGIGNAIVGKSHTEAVKAVMEGYQSSDRRYLLFSVKSSEGQGCYHPTAATHARWADELSAAIKADLGW
jgi:hypothetical protein